MPRPPRLLRAALIAATALSTTACGTYLHDSGLQAQTAAIKTDFTALKAPTFIAEQRKRMEDFGAREDEAVAAFVVSRRDQAILHIVRPNPVQASSNESVAALKKQVAKDLRRIVPPTGPEYSPEELSSIWTAHARLLRVDMARVDLATTVAATARIYSNAGDDPKAKERPTACDAALKRARPVLTQKSTNVDRAYDAHWLSCDYLRQQSTPADDLEMLLAGAGGELGRVREDIQASDAKSATAQAEAKELGRAVKAALDRQGDPPTPNELLALADKIKKANASAQVAALGQLEAPMEDALKSVLTNAELTTRKGAIALDLLNAGRNAAVAWSAEPDITKGRALLIGIAELRHRLNIANLDVALEKERRRLLQAQMEALLLGASRLAWAEMMMRDGGLNAPQGFGDLRQAAPSDRRRLSEALTAYQSAWNVGEVPYQVLQFREIQARRLYAIDRAALTEADYRAILAPAIDQMAAYGEGGVKPDTIVTLLGDLGIAGAILGQ